MVLSKKAGNLCQKSRPIVQNTGGGGGVCEKFVNCYCLHVIVNLLFSKLSKVFISMDDANLVEKLDLKLFFILPLIRLFEYCNRLKLFVYIIHACK